MEHDTIAIYFIAYSLKIVNSFSSFIGKKDNISMG